MTGISFSSVFNLEDLDSYHCWRAEKLQCNHNKVSANIMEPVRIADPYCLRDSEKRALQHKCAIYNMVTYQLDNALLTDKSLVATLGQQLGLVRLDANLRADEDAISSLYVKAQPGNQYIPYTNKALSWHTDGYYNESKKWIYAIIMHCVSAAVNGGVNYLMDHEMLYLYLRDENPQYIKALMHPQTMTIPANIESGKVIRAPQAGPVFSLHQSSGRLHMRYSARSRNILWRDDDLTREAVASINMLLTEETRFLKVTLQAGQGIICNNVLHNRSEFHDSALRQRLLYRGRYYDRIAEQ